MDFVESCNVYVGKMIIKAAKRIFNSDKMCRSYNDLNFGVTFLKHSVYGDNAFQITHLHTTAINSGHATQLTTAHTVGLCWVASLSADCGYNPG